MQLFKMMIRRHATELGNLTKKTSSRKVIVRFVNYKYCKKALINKRKFTHINSETKYNFSKNNTFFINENLTRTNKSIVFCGRKLKLNGEIHSCYTRNGIVHIKKTEHLKALKVYHINLLYDTFPEFEFFQGDGSEFFRDGQQLSCLIFVFIIS